VASLVRVVAGKLARRGLRRGLLEGSVAWIVIGAAAWVVHFVTRPEAPLVAKKDLRLGESLLVTHVGPPDTACRRHGRRAAGAVEHPGAS
jgi:hypothetical protein